jgi:hypothetical protein
MRATLLRANRSIGLAAVLMQALPAQTASDRTVPRFDVASVKVSKPSTGDPFQFRSMLSSAPMMKGGPGTSSPGRIRYSNLTLMGLIAKAYNLHMDQVAGSHWLTQDQYNVDGIVPADATTEQFLKMLQNLLSERHRCPVLPSLHRAGIGSRSPCTTYVGWSMQEFAEGPVALAIGSETGIGTWTQSSQRLQSRYQATWPSH